MTYLEIVKTLREEHYGAILLMDQLLKLEHDELADDYDGAENMNEVCMIQGKRAEIRRLRSSLLSKSREC